MAGTGAAVPGGGPAPRLSVVIPAYNEAGRLPATLERVVAYLRESGRWLPAEVVVVDDGSSDATAEVAAAVPAAAGLSCRAVRHERNRGKGAAVRTGFAASRGALVLLSDADLSSPIAEVERLAGAAGPGSVAVGSRAVDRALITIRQPLHRDLMGRTFNGLTRVLGLSGLHDTQCGFKLFPGPLARALAGVQRLDGFAYDVELLLLARRWGFAVREVGVRWDHVEASRVAPLTHSPQMLLDLLRLAAWRLTGRLPARPSGLR